MNTPIITWACIVGLFAFILLTKFIHAVYISMHAKSRFIELGTEQEEVYVPGDPLPLPQDDDNSSSSE